MTEINVKSPIGVSSSPFYSVIISDAEDTRHFFLEKDGELFYDGNCQKVQCDEEKAEEALDA